METFSALLALCEGNLPVTGARPSQRANNSGFSVSVDISLYILLKQSRYKWMEKSWRSLDVTVLTKGHCYTWRNPQTFWSHVEILGLKSSSNILDFYHDIKHPQNPGKTLVSVVVSGRFSYILQSINSNMFRHPPHPHQYPLLPPFRPLRNYLCTFFST